ncbi:hypothetical protein FQR65_LT00054 [Abscondita terminalis]|nr:hypothetical protein FQR65_LT00054 [Abscondita terminalis]
MGRLSKALTNIHEMMKPYGKMLICFIGKSILYDVFHSVSNNPKWKKYMSEINKTSPPYHSMHYYETLLKKIGFEQFESEEVKKHRSYSEQETFGSNYLFYSLNVYPIPKSQEHEFIQDHMEFFEKKGYLTVDDDGVKRFHFHYNLFVISATKSLII